MDTFQEEEEVSAVLPLKTVKCLCPSLIRQTAERQGVMCQKIFERAYERSGKPDSYGRAVLVRFLSIPPDDREKYVPVRIREYCERSEKMTPIRMPRQKGFCLGCCINPKAKFGLIFSYRMIHPEVNDRLMQEEARGPQKKVEAHSLREKPPSEADKIFLTIEDSGLFDFPEEDWDTDMRGSDSAQEE